MPRILVAYVSHSGSTAEVAEAVGSELRALGHIVVVMAARSVRDCSSYDAVVAGGLLYRFGWHPDMLTFLKQHMVALKVKPVAMFVTGLLPAGASDGEGMPCPVSIYPDESAGNSGRTLISLLKRALPLIEAIKPRSLAYFRGKVDAASLAWPERVVMWIILKISRIKPGDYRNWNAIREWARELEFS